MLDVENKKFLDKARLSEIALELGEHLTETEIEELIEYDFDCPNRKVDVDSFYQMMIKNMTEIKHNEMDLQAACRGGDLSLIKVAYFTDPSKLNEKDSSLGWSPLYRTVICGHFEAANYLLQQGADPNICNSLGETPLHQAADNSQYAIAELLLKFRANPNSQQRDGDTPLHHSAFRGDFKMLDLLLQNKADPNISNFMVIDKKFGRTPLHYAVDCGHLGSLKVLVSGKADPYLKDKQGKTAFDLCNTQELLNGLKEAYELRKARDGQQSPIGEVTTYFVNDSGSNERNSYITETFGRESCNVKISIVSPVSEQSEKSFTVSPLYTWLENHRLEDCYEALTNAGYYNVDMLIRQMIGPMPLSEKNLKEIGIQKPGHRRLLLINLEEESGIGKQLSGSLHKSKSKSWNCCSSNQGTTKARNYPTLCEWLDEMGLTHLHDLFVEAGYDSYQSLAEIQRSLHPLNSRILDQEIGIKEAEQRMTIIRKLQTEIENDEVKKKITFDGTQKVGCDSCRII